MTAGHGIDEHLARFKADHDDYSDILLLNREAGAAPIKGVPLRVISHLVYAGGLSGVDEDDPFLVLDDPRVDGQPLRPLWIEEHVRHARQTFAARFRLGSPDLYQAGADGVDCRHVSSR